MEDSRGVLDGEQHGGAAQDVELDHQDAVCPSNGSDPLNGENLEDIQNDAVPHDNSEPLNEFESDTGALLRGEDDAEAEVVDDDSSSQYDHNVDADAETEERAVEERSDLYATGPREPSSEVAGADAETEERPVVEHSDLYDAEPHEPSSEVAGADAETEERTVEERSDLYDTEPHEPTSEVCGAHAETEERAVGEHSDLHDTELHEPGSQDADAVHGADVVDAPSPMDVDESESQPTDTAKTPPSAGCDDAMEVEYATAAEDAGSSTGSHLAADAVGNETDQVLPMAEDADDSGSQYDHRPAESASELQDSENIPDQSAVSDAAEYDEVDALPSKVSRQGEVSANSQEVDESGNSEGLVEGADFTVELRPDTSEQESAASEVDQPAAESDAAEKSGIESESLEVDQSDKTSDDVKTTASDGSSAIPPASSDAVRVSS